MESPNNGNVAADDLRPQWVHDLEKANFNLAEELPKLAQHWYTCSFCSQGFVDTSNPFCESTFQWKAYFEENVFSNKTSDQVVREIATLPDACKPLLFIWYGMSLAKPVRSDSSVATQLQQKLDDANAIGQENNILRNSIQALTEQNAILHRRSQQLDALFTILNELLQSNAHLRESVARWHGTTDAPIKAPELMRYVTRYVNELSEALRKSEQSFVDEKGRGETLSKQNNELVELQKTVQEKLYEIFDSIVLALQVVLDIQNPSSVYPQLQQLVGNLQLQARGFSDLFNDQGFTSLFSGLEDKIRNASPRSKSELSTETLEHVDNPERIRELFSILSILLEALSKKTFTSLTFDELQALTLSLEPTLNLIDKNIISDEEKELIRRLIVALRTK